MAFIDCNFAKCALRQLTASLASKNGRLSIADEDERLKQFNLLYADCKDLCFHIDLTDRVKVGHLNRKIKELLFKFNNRRWDKEVFLDSFCIEKWNSLSLSKKRTHSLQNCRGCYVDYPNLKFPWKAYALKGKNPLLKLADSHIVSSAVHHNTYSSEGISRLATEIYSKINETFQSITGVTFGEALTNVKDANVQKKQNKVEKENSVNKIRKDLKRKIEENLNEADKDRPYQCRESLSNYERTTRNEFLVKRPRKSTSSKRHSPRNPYYDINAVEAELSILQPGTAVNWEKLARKHGVKSQNAGQTLKEHLTDRNFDTSVFRNTIQRKYNCSYERRSRKKLFSKVSMPRHLTKGAVKDNLLHKVANGDYDIGVPCITSELNSPSLEDGSLINKVTLVDGRKIPLLDIRKRMLLEQEKFLKCKTDADYDIMGRQTIIEQLAKFDENFSDSDDTEILRDYLKASQRTRNLKIWHDHSSIENHGHMLFMISCVFDSAIFYTNEEFRERCGYYMDVEATVERPWIYILGMSGDSTSEQLKYVDSRIVDLLDLNHDISTATGITVRDVLRFHHGDHPAMQFEFGISQGGEYCCVGCPASSSSFGDFAYSMRQPIRSLEDICNTATTGPHGRVPNVRKTVRSLKKHELEEELDAWNATAFGKVSELREQLKDLRCGIESVPALLCHNPSLSLESINMSKLEPMLTEPLHDCKGHIENIFTELEAKEHECTSIRKFKRSVFGDQDKIRGKDYRKAVYILPEFLKKQKAPSQYIEMAVSLREICAILYMRSSSRTRQSILRLHNQLFIHSVHLREIFGNPQKISQRKMFGVYFHGLLHSALLNRIVSPRSCNTELQEAEFSALRDISRRTSNHHPDQIIPNMLIRRQAERETKCTITSLPDDKFDQFGTMNSVIKHEWLSKHATAMQAHCENISDYLEQGPGVWWNRNEYGDIEFFDELEQSSRQNPRLPKLQHFRSCSQKLIQKDLQARWDRLIASGTCIPLLKVKIYEHGRLVRTKVLVDGSVPACSSSMSVIDSLPAFSSRSDPLPSFSSRSDLLTTCSSRTDPLPTCSSRTDPPPTCSSRSDPLPSFSSISDPLPTCSSRTDPLPTCSSRTDHLPACSSRSDPLPTCSSRSDPLPSFSSISDPLPTCSSRTDPLPTCSSRSDPPPTCSSRSDPLPSFSSISDPLPTCSSRTDPLPTCSSRSDPLPTCSSRTDPLPTCSSRTDPLPTCSSRSDPLPTCSSRSDPPPTCSSTCRSDPLASFSSKSDPLPTFSSRSDPLPTFSSRSDPLPTCSSRSDPLGSDPLPISSPTCVTSEGKLLIKLFGELPEIIDLDMYRSRAKDKQNPRRLMYSQKYNETLPFLQTKVLKLHSDTIKAIKAYEVEYFVVQGKVPEKDKPPLLDLLFRQKNCEILLKHWKWGI